MAKKAAGAMTDSAAGDGRGGEPRELGCRRRTQECGARYNDRLVGGHDLCLCVVAWDVYYCRVCTLPNFTSVSDV